MSEKTPLAVKNPYGQYFTPNHVASFMIKLSDINKNSEILEPCCGEGVFLDILLENGFKNITAYEIDPKLNNPDFVINESFVSAKILSKFDLIIGNPPYIRWKNLEDELKKELSNNSLWNTYFNSLCDYLYIFILKSITLLKNNGELIFICPEFWMNTKHSKILREYMLNNGFFSDIIHFSESKVFNKVNSSIIIFKYIKGKNENNIKINVTKVRGRQTITPDILDSIYSKEELPSVDYFQIKQFDNNSRWVLENDKEISEIEKIEKSCTLTIEDVCDIGNGMVSGLDAAFQINGNLNDDELKLTRDIIKGKNLCPYVHKDITKYIFIDKKISEKELINRYPHFYEHLKPYIEKLNARYQYNKHFDYWEWVFPRNYDLLSRDEKRIFVPCKERISNKNYFRFALVEPGIYSTQDVTALFKKQSVKESIEYIVALLNTPQIFKWVSLKGTIKGGVVEFSEAPLNRIPFRSIDWNNPLEIEIHDEITKIVKNMIYNKTANSSEIDEINILFDKLFSIENKRNAKYVQNRLSDFGIINC